MWCVPGSFVTGNLSQCPTLTLRREKFDYGDIRPEINSTEVLSVDESSMEVRMVDLRECKVIHLCIW